MNKQTTLTDSKLHSPCVDNCCLDEHDVCLGCGRLLSEILSWRQSTLEQRNEILTKCRIRQAQRQDLLKRC